MKAILVIDTPDNLKNHLDKVKVDVIGTLNGQDLFHRLNQSLIPMPQKSGLVHPDANGWCEFSEYSLGWNDCLEEIMGETE